MGRAAERSALERLLTDARTGRSGVLGLVGEPGIGKTALLDHAAFLAQGMRVLRARGVASETAIPFAGLSDLLRPTLGALHTIPAPQAQALRGALALAPATAGDRFAIGAATLSLLSAYAEEGPALLLVDDVHLLDPASASALLFAARRLLADPIAVVVAAREGEHSLLDDSGLATLQLTGLDSDDARRLLPTVDEETAARLFTATGGNPLALLELAREPARAPLAAGRAALTVPDSIAEAFLRRTALLPDETRELLLLVAASDVDDLGMLGQAAAAYGVSMSALAPAEEAGLVTVRDGRLRFQHPLLRTALYTGAAPASRRAAHRALAGVLPDRDSDRRAWHLAAAALGPDVHASRAQRQAGERARERSAYAVATSAFERAARLASDHAERADLLYEAAGSAVLAGETERALSLLDEVRSFATDGRVVALADHLRGQVTASRGPVAEGSRLIADAASRLATSDPELAVTMLAEAVHSCVYACETTLMTTYADQATVLADGANSLRADFFAAMARALAHVVAGDAHRGIGDARLAVRILEQLDEQREDPRLVVWASLGVMWLREEDVGRGVVERALRRVRVESAVGVLPLLLHHLGRDQATTDRWSAAEASFDEAIRIARESGQFVELAAALAGLAWLEARQGREDACRLHAEEAAALCTALGVVFYAVWAVQALGDLELGLGRPDQALLHYERQAALMQSAGFVDVDVSADGELVGVLLRLDRPEEARAAATRYAEAAEAKEQPWALARARRCEALLAAGGAAEELFEEALRLHARTPDGFETARTRLAYGAALRRGRHKLRAREQLHSALDAFVALGAESWAAQTTAELAATGEVARRRDGSTLVSLTPQEYQVARLLADGRTTREAAAAVFLSPKTVEYHLRSVYRKLGISSRAELAKALPA